jgi:hypothetical protein
MHPNELGELNYFRKGLDGNHRRQLKSPLHFLQKAPYQTKKPRKVIQSFRGFSCNGCQKLLRYIFLLNNLIYSFYAFLDSPTSMINSLPGISYV